MERGIVRVQVTFISDTSFEQGVACLPKHLGVFHVEVGCWHYGTQAPLAGVPIEKKWKKKMAYLLL